MLVVARVSAPERHPRLGSQERLLLAPVIGAGQSLESAAAWLSLLRLRQTWGLVAAKFLSDAAWYFYLFWLPKYLYDARGFDIKAVGAFAWIPYAAAGIGCLVGGSLSSWLLTRQVPLDRARKIALGLSAVVMPAVWLVPRRLSRGPWPSSASPISGSNPGRRS